MQQASFSSLLANAKALLPRLIELEETKPSPIALIDGRAGAGKSSFAALIKEEFFKTMRRTPRVVHMDDLYPGWNGLTAGSLYLLEKILEPVARGRPAHWQQWDWSQDKRGGSDPGNGWREFAGGSLLIVEGCGAVSKANIEFADLTVWIESSLEKRLQRFNARDDGRFASQFEFWSQQEEVFYLGQDSRKLCDLVIEN